MRICDILLNLLQKKVGSPCHTLKVTGTQQRTKPLANVTYSDRILKVYWPQTVTRVTEKDLYVWRNLCAEIGGYVGMFWGFSLLNLADGVVVVIHSCLDKFHWRKQKLQLPV